MTALGIALLAIGAVLRYAVTVEASGVDLDMVGLILMAAGGVATLFGLFEGKFRSTRTETVVSRDGGHVVEQTDTSQT